MSRPEPELLQFARSIADSKYYHPAVLQLAHYVVRQAEAPPPPPPNKGVLDAIYGVMLGLFVGFLVGWAVHS